MVVMDQKTKLFFLSLLPILLFSVSYGAIETFTLNSTDFNVNDTYYNVADQYASYLEYENPYAFVCADLNECYLDDTNSGSEPEDSFLIEFFLDSNSAWNQNNTWSYKYNDIDGNIILFATYWNDVTGEYAFIHQRNSVYEVIKDVPFQDYAIATRTCSSSGSTSSSTDSFLVNVTCLSAIGTNHLNAQGLSFYDEQNTIILWNATDFQAGTPTTALSSFVLSHNPIDEVGFQFYFLHSNYANRFKILTSNNTDYSGATELSISGITALPYSFDRLISDYGKFYGLRFRTFNDFELWFGIPSVDYTPPEDNYRSVALPTCEDIYPLNVQTDFYHNDSLGRWFRECAGIIPTGNETIYECSLECLEYTNIYAPNNKTFTALISPSAVSYTTHISMVNRADSYGYIFPSGTDLSDIGDVRIYSYLEFESNNVTQTFSITGWNQLATVPDSFTHVQPYSEFERTCYNGVQNVTAYGTWGYISGVLINEIARSYTSLQFYEDTFSVERLYITYTLDWLELNGYYNAHFDFTKATSECGSDLWTPIDTLGNKNLIIYVEWDNETDKETVCSQYAPICYPVVPENETYDNDSIVCIGSECYVVGEDICNLNAICETDRGESNANCPEDCPVITIPEQVNIITDTLDSGMSYLGSILGTDNVGAKALIWFILSLIVGAVLGGFLAVKGASGGGAGLIGSIGIFGMMLVGTVIGWLPIWFGLIFLIIAGLLITSVVRGAFGGGL